ncbi:odorant receptor 22c-like [Mycetomoellerius zeteki]|uniref:odorant receptor 22c-like n=1 Tax=Mycetomoellerius zeteki TaxID=64791 RepID=UPI00084ECD09|nr:PREDICTED: odorant receptor 22c-like [Trachymyrmex zeteki]
MILMVDNLQVTLPLLVVSLKLVIMRWKQTALLSIIKMMAEDWMELKTRKERDVMMRQAQVARIIVISGYILMVLAFIVVIVLPYFGLSLRRLTNLTDPGKPLPLQTYYFYDIDKSPQFELTYIVQAITVFLAAVTYTSIITEGSNFSFARLCFPLIGITILLSHTFLYCGAGEIITMQCEEVYRALCDLEWYRLEPQYARSLILLMIRASQPVRITAGKIFPLTMTTFCSLLKTSAGYISFLLANQK